MLAPDWALVRRVRRLIPRTRIHTMNKLLTLALAAFLCTPAFAQKMGSRNRNAPTIKQSITVGGQTLSLDYTSIAWGNTLRANVSETRVRVVFSVEGAGIADDQAVEERLRGSPGVGVHGAKPRRAQRVWA